MSQPQHPALSYASVDFVRRELSSLKQLILLQSQQTTQNEIRTVQDDVRRSIATQNELTKVETKSQLLQNRENILTETRRICKQEITEPMNTQRDHTQTLRDHTTQLLEHGQQHRDHIQSFTNQKRDYEARIENINRQYKNQISELQQKNVSLQENMKTLQLNLKQIANAIRN